MTDAKKPEPFAGFTTFMEYFAVTLKLVSPMLGTVSKNEDMYDYHAKQKARSEAEKTGKGLSDEQIAEEELTMTEQFIQEKGWSGFHGYDNSPVIYNYVLGGFIKEAIAGLRRTKGTKSAAITAYKKTVDQQVFIYPRLIPFISPDEPFETLETLERPLRGQTAQGERVTLVKSDMIQPGALLTFEIHVFKGKVTENVLKEVLAYGIYKGLGQWRSGGYGQFTVVEFEKLAEPTLSPYDKPAGLLP